MLRTGELDEKVLIVLLLLIIDDLDADRLERDARCEHDEAFSLNTVELSATLRNRVTQRNHSGTHISALTERDALREAPRE
jgi:hypothetical protein